MPGILTLLALIAAACLMQSTSSPMAVLDKSKSKPTITEALPSGNDNPTGPAFPNTSQRNRSVPRAQNPPSNQHDIHNLSVATGNRLQHAKALPGNEVSNRTGNTGLQVNQGRKSTLSLLNVKKQPSQVSI